MAPRNREANDYQRELGQDLIQQSERAARDLNTADPTQLSGASDLQRANRLNTHELDGDIEAFASIESDDLDDSPPIRSPSRRRAFLRSDAPGPPTSPELPSPTPQLSLTNRQPNTDSSPIRPSISSSQSYAPTQPVPRYSSSDREMDDVSDGP